MFENFPYTDMHQLNLDWIIKIAKDFLDQYTHLQELISNGETSLQNLTTEGLEQLQAKADALENLLQQWYNTHSTDIADQLADALTDLQNEITQTFNTFNTNVQNRVAEAIESIPDDYTALSNKVDALETDFTEAVLIDGNKQVTVSNLIDTDTNVLYCAQEKHLTGYDTYKYEEIYEYSGTFLLNELFSFVYESIEGNTATPPFAFYLYNGNTEIRHVYTTDLDITEADINAGINKLVVRLYPARGTAMPTGDCVFKNLFLLHGGYIKYKFTNNLKDALLNTMTESNVYCHSDNIIVRGTLNYVYHRIYDFRGTIRLGDVFTILYDNVTGASTSEPFTIQLFHNNTEIRHVNNPHIEIVNSDISSDVNRVVFTLYPAKGVALSSGYATYTGITVIKGSIINYKMSGMFKNAVDNTVSDNMVLFEAATYKISSSGRYADTQIYNEYNLDLHAGDVYTLLYDTVEGATDTYPQALYVCAGNTTIRHTVFPRLEITDDDIAAGANRIMILLYPAKGTVMPTGHAVYTNVRLLKSIAPGYKFSNVLESAAGDENAYGIIPDYYFDNNYLKNKIARIRTLAKSCLSNGNMFFFITDQHLMYNAGHSPALIRHIAKHCNIDLLINGGDLADHGSYALSNTMRHEFDGKIYTACGNHEWMNPISGSDLYFMLDNYNSNQIGNNDKHYYYVDDIQNKTRYIILSSYVNNPDASETAAISGYTQEQLTWLTNTAFNKPADWNIIIITHYIGIYSTSSISGYQQFLTAIDNHNAQYNDIICIIQGHAHYDAIWHTTGGLPIITTTCDKNMPWISNGTNRETWLSDYRDTGTINEQAFDVVIIDKTNRQIHCVRIGCPAYNNVDVTPASSDFSYVPALEERTINY